MEYKKIYKTEATGELKDHLYKYILKLPKHIADWDVWDYWEMERTESIAKHLNKDSVLFDIGSEQGSLTALYGKYITSKMVLVEPSPQFWTNIKAIWEANIDTPPLATYSGFISDKGSKYGGIVNNGKFPIESDGKMVEAMAYEYLHDNVHDISSLTIDDLVVATGQEPDGITIDIEGAELLALKGAESTLKEIRPLVWVSVHPDLSQRDYNTKESELMAYMKKMKYKAEFISQDHEFHYLFKPQ